jgi:PAS domain S-box-containing protein
MPRRGLPDQRTLLRWILIGRIGVLFVTVVAAIRLRDRIPDDTGTILAIVAAAAIVTAEGLWWTGRGAFEPTRKRLAVQAVTDVILVTALVHLAGPQSAYAALYVLAIAIYAVVLPIEGGLGVTLCATALYLVDALVLQRDSVVGTFWAQVAVFNVIFVSVALLGSRLREVTAEQATLETELRRVRLEASDILQHIHSGLVTVDGAGRLVYINPTGERLLQLEAAEFGNRPVLDELRGRSLELWAAVMQGIRGGPKVSRGEGLVAHEDGRVFPIGLSTTTFQLDAEGPPSVTAVFTDISDSKRLQEMHLRAERSEAVAALSASLAHEIRNPLASIRSSVEQLARHASADDDDQVLARLIVRESDRLSRLLGEFLDFSRVRKTKAEVIDLHDIAATVVRLVRAHPDTGEDVSFVLEGVSAVMEGDEDLLHRVLMNLVLNAAQAATGPCTIRVRTGPADNGDLPDGTGMGAAVKLQVEDDGPGIPEEIRDRLFEPFVSRRQGGSGLGLAIVQRAIEAHRGYVFLDSTPGEGTTFTIYLPVRWTAEQAA